MKHIAQIIPVKRLPKGVNVFDYSIPEDLLPKIQVGQLVTVPIRERESYGIVLSTSALTKNQEPYSTKIKPITQIITEVPLVSETHLKVLQIVSKWYGVSLGTLLKTSLLPLQKRKLKSITPLPFQKPQKHDGEVCYATYINEKERTKHLVPHRAGQTLILVPEAKMIERTANLLGKEKDHTFCFWHSGMSQKDAFTTWMSVRNNTAKTIIGTRTAGLLSFYDLKKIVIDYSHNEQHKQADQSPRFHTHDLALLLRSCLGIDIVFSTFSPAIQHLAHMKKNAQTHIFPTPTIIDIRSERSHRNYSVLSHAAENALHQTKEDMFFLLNRKGFARSLTCLTCGFTFRCPGCQRPFQYHQNTNRLSCEYCKETQAVGLTCPTCNSTVVKLRGAGIELVEQTVRKLTTHLPHKIYRIDGNLDILPKEESGPRIIVGTQKALSHIRWKKTSLIVCVSLDQELIFPEYTAEERVWHTIKDIQYHMNDQASFFIQTMNPDHPLFTHINNTKKFFTHITKQRFALQYPPYTYIVRYIYGDKNEEKAKKEAEKAKKIIEESLTNDLKYAIIDSCYPMHPKYSRGKYWYGILVKLPKKTWYKDIVTINSIFSRGWKIDPNPTSIFRP